MHDVAHYAAALLVGGVLLARVHFVGAAMPLPGAALLRVGRLLGRCQMQGGCSCLVPRLATAGMLCPGHGGEGSRARGNHCPVPILARRLMLGELLPVAHCRLLVRVRALLALLGRSLALGGMERERVLVLLLVLPGGGLLVAGAGRGVFVVQEAGLARDRLLLAAESPCQRRGQLLLRQEVLDQLGSGWRELPALVELCLPRLLLGIVGTSLGFGSL